MAVFKKGEVNQITSLDAFKASVAEPGLAVVDCFAEWCAPCKMIAPKLHELAKDYPEIRFYQVDVDAAPDVAQELNVRAMPTFKFFENGKAGEDIVGANVNALVAAVKRGRDMLKEESSA